MQPTAAPQSAEADAVPPLPAPAAPSRPRSTRTVLVVATVGLFAALAAAAWLVVPRLANLVAGRPSGPLLLATPSDDGVVTYFFGVREGGEVLRGPRLAQGQLLVPTTVPGDQPSASPLIPWQDGTWIVGTLGDGEASLMEFDETGTEVDELTSVDAAFAAVFVDPSMRAVVLEAYTETSERCTIVRPGQEPVELIEGGCTLRDDRVGVTSGDEVTTDVVVYDLGGEVDQRATFDVGFGRLTSDLAWVVGTVATDDGVLLRVYDRASGDLVHESKPVADVSILAMPAGARGVVYAADGGEDVLSVSWVRRDGEVQDFGEAGAAAAVISDDGSTVWYAVGDVDGASRRAYRAEVGSDETPEIGTGDNLTFTYVGGEAQRLLAVAWSERIGTELYVPDTDGSLTLAGAYPRTSYSGAGVNPGTSTVYVALDPYATESGSPRTGALLRLPNGATRAEVVADGERGHVGTVVTDADEEHVIVVTTEVDDRTLTTWWEGRSTILDSGTGLGPVFVDGDQVYFGIDEGSGDVTAKTSDIEGARAPESVLDDYFWYEVPGARREVQVTEGSLAVATQARIDYGRRLCREEGYPTVNPFAAGGVGIGAGQRSTCVRVPTGGVLYLTVDAPVDTTMSVYGYREDDSWTLGYDDDSGASLNPLVSGWVAPGTYLVQMGVYGYSDSLPAFQLYGCIDETGDGNDCTGFATRAGSV